MKIIRPNPITSSMVTINVPELYATWSSATTYALAARVVYGDFVYESVQASNLNKQPDTQPLWWIKIGSTQKMAAFDGQLSDVVSTTANNIQIIVQPNSIIDSISYFGLIGYKTTITIKDGGASGAIVYEDEVFLDGSESVSWYQYFFFDPFLSKNQVLFTNIPPISNPYIIITVENLSGTRQLGEVVMGRMYSLGCAAFGANAGIIDYSRKDTDDFGNTTFVRRAYSKRVECQIVIDNFDLNRVQRVLYDVRATPLTWIVADDPRFEEPLVVYGFYRDFVTEIAYPNHSLCNIEIEGLT